MHEHAANIVQAILQCQASVLVVLLYRASEVARECGPVRGLTVQSLSCR